MVGQERQHSALIWREALSLVGDYKLYAHWELVREGDEQFFARQYATIQKQGNRKWMLQIWAVPIHDELRSNVTYHKTLREAKAMGIVNVRFNQAQLTN
jgi:hypothetical protein